MQITKGRVLEVFTRHFQKLTTSAKHRRAADAYNASLKELAPWREGMSSSERDRMDLIADYLEEIIREDHGVTPHHGERTLTDTESAGADEGRKAGEEFLKTNSHLVTPVPATEEATDEWSRRIYARGLEWVPKDRIADKEWTAGFLMGFAGVVWRYKQTLPA